MAKDTMFRVTVDGGIPIARGNMGLVAVTIVGDHAGRRYVRRMDNLFQVLTVDLQRNSIIFNNGNRQVPPTSWPEWVNQLCAMLRAAIPNLTQGDIPDGTHTEDGSEPAAPAD